jgi:hypothetical protein
MSIVIAHFHIEEDMINIAIYTVVLYPRKFAPQRLIGALL